MLVRLLYDNDDSACELTEHKIDASMKEESSTTSDVAIFLIAGVLQPLSSSRYRNIRLKVRAGCGWLLLVGDLACSVVRCSLVVRGSLSLWLVFAIASCIIC